MPKISYRTLSKYLDGFKNLKDKKPDPTHLALIENIISAAKLLHDNQKLTSQDERQLLYNDMMQYIEIYDSVFSSDPSKVTATNDFNTMVALGKSITDKAAALASKTTDPDWSKTLNGLTSAVTANTNAATEGANKNDIERYTNTAYDILQKAQQLSSGGKLDSVTADMMLQLTNNLELIKVNPAISTEDKRAVARDISRIMTFYQDNLFDRKKRSELRSEKQLEDFNKLAIHLMTENKTALDAISKAAPDSAEKISEKINKTNDDLSADLNSMVAMVQSNNWADWETRKIQIEKEVREEHAKQEQEMREEHGFKTVEQEKLQQLIDLRPEQYKKVPYLNGVMAVLGIDPEQLPAEDITYQTSSGKTVTKNLRKELADLKTKALNAVTQTANFFADERENSHYMNLDEIKQTDEVNYDFTSQCSKFIGALKRSELQQEKKDEISTVINDAKASFTNTDIALTLADRYITEYANDGEIEQMPLFSMYEMQGMLPPDIDGSFPRQVQELNKVVSDLELKNTGADAKKAEKKQIKSTVDSYNAKIKEPLRKLVNEVLPEQFRFKDADVGENDVMKTVTADDVKELYSAYDAVYQGIVSFEQDYKKLKAPTAEEKKLFESLQSVHKKVENKRRLLGYLADEKGNSLNDDIEEFKKLPDEQRKNNENAKLFVYAGGCKEHFRLGTLLPQYLLDDMNAPRLANVLSMMDKKKDIDAANDLEKKVSKIEWDNGKRCLDSLKNIDLYKRQIGSADNVYQFATDNDHETFKQVFETTMKTMPASLKKIEAEDKEGKKVTVDLEELLRKQLDKFLYIEKNGEKKPADLNHTFNWHNQPGVEYTDDGFGTFKSEYNNFGESEKAVNEFIERLNRNAYNAGFGAYSFDSSHKMKGYNEGIAKAFASQLDSDGIIPSAKLLKETKLPLAGGKAKFDQVSNITVVRTEPRFNKTGKYAAPNAIEKPPFYITTKNFRACDFVGDMYEATYYDIDPAKLEGKSAQEIEAEHKRLKDLAAKQGLVEGEKNKKFKAPITSSVRDYDVFNNYKCIGNAADLQVMDYLLGIPKRTTDDIRIAFKMGTGPNGMPKPMISGIGGTMDDKKPFMISAEDPEASKKLTNPDDMLIMTEKMASNVKRWANRSFTKEEKELLKQLPKQAQDDFDLRCQGLVLKLEKSKDHQFPDIKNDSGKLMYGGLVTERGYIRVVSDEELKKLPMDALAIGRNNTSFKERDNAEPVNIFDTLASMPNACHKALNDKYIAHWKGCKSHVRGEGINDDDKTVIGYESYDKYFNCLEAERVTLKSNSLLQDVTRMHHDRSKEYAWHKYIQGDSSEYYNVLSSVEELANTSNHMRALLKLEGEYLSNPNAFKAKSAEYAQYAKEIEEARKNRLAFEQKLAKEKGMPVPHTLPPVDKDPHAYHMVQELSNTARENIEKYLRTNNSYKTDFGKVRRKHMVSIYNKINTQMEEYAYLSGNTTYVPKKCIMDPTTLEIKYKNLYGDRRTFEVEGVNPVTAKDYLDSEALAVNSKEKQKIQQLNLDIRQEKGVFSERLLELGNKISKNIANEKEKAEYEAIKNKYNPKYDEWTTFSEGEIRTAKSQYGDPNTKKGRKVNPTLEQPKPKPKGKGM